jgi:hypothetical protein
MRCLRRAADLGRDRSHRRPALGGRFCDPEASEPQGPGLGSCHRPALSGVGASVKHGRFQRKRSELTKTAAQSRVDNQVADAWLTAVQPKAALSAFKEMPVSTIATRQRDDAHHAIAFNQSIRCGHFVGGSEPALSYASRPSSCAANSVLFRRAVEAVKRLLCLH